MMNKDITKAICSILVLVAGGLCAEACVAPANTEDEVGEASLTLGETACETVTRDDVETLGIDGNFCPATGYSFSPDATYDHAGCPHQYVVGYGSFESNNVHARVFWEGDPITGATQCQAAHLTLAAYTENNGVWATPQTTKMHGVWNPFFDPQCRFFTDDDSVPLDTIGPGTKHRLAASAYQLYITGTTSPFPSYTVSTTYAKVGVRLFIEGVCLAP